MTSYNECEKFYFHHPSSVAVVGSSSSGKSTLTLQILRNVRKLFKPLPEKLVVFYKKYQPIYEEFKNISDFSSVELVDNISSSILKTLKNCIIVLDDYMLTAFNDKNIQEIFTTYSHHDKISVFLLTQNCYPKGKYSKDIRLNLHYFILLKSPTVKCQVRCLSHQLFPEKRHFLIDAYEKATTLSYSYLVVVCHPNWCDDYRVYSSIFDKHPKVYIKN